MEKQLISTLPYDKVDFRFIIDHYDIHLNGTCIYNGELCEFENEYPDYDEDKGEWEEMYVKIYKLNFFDKLKCYLDQWLFEKCVGYHWSYKNGKRGKDFSCRNPKWLYKMLFKFYYKIIK